MGERLPSPFGWFAIGVSSDYAPGHAVPAKWFDQDLVVFRSEDGTLAALDAYCRHLGAHLGYGGTVSEGSITCPFHGYRWAADGTCLSVPYGNRMAPGVRVPTVPVVEQDGVVLLWRGSGDEPTWHMPRLFDGQRWTAPQVTRRTIRSHPQEIMENGVDFAHFLFIHQTHIVEPKTNLRVDGHVFEFTCESAPDAVEPELRLPDGVPLEGRIFLHGAGFGGNMMMPKGMPIQAMQRVYATPVGDDEVSLIIMVNIRIDEGCDEPTADALMPTLSSEVFDQLGRDIVIWEHKRYLRRPALNPKERVISTYRRWYAQYYDDPGAPTPAAEPLAQTAPA